MHNLRDNALDPCAIHLAGYHFQSSVESSTRRNLGDSSLSFLSAILHGPSPPSNSDQTDRLIPARTVKSPACDKNGTSGAIFGKLKTGGSRKGTCTRRYNLQSRRVWPIYAARATAPITRHGVGACHCVLLRSAAARRYCNAVS
jgi:hypothetical protein